MILAKRVRISAYPLEKLSDHLQQDHQTSPIRSLSDPHFDHKLYSCSEKWNPNV